MKAKSKVLLGLLVALAMMVMAVPAFADGMIDSITPETQEVYVGGKATITVKVTPVDTSDSAAAVTVKGTDTTANMDNAVKFNGGDAINFVQDTTDKTLYKKEIDVAAANVKADEDTDHTISVEVKQGESVSTGTATVTVHPAISATLVSVPNDAKNGFEETVQKGKKAKANVTCDAEGVTYQWQSSSTTDDADDAYSTEWTDISGKDAAGIGTVDNLSGKYIRCLVIKGTGKFVAKGEVVKKAEEEGGEDETTVVYCVKINVTDESGIVITTQPTAPTDPYFKGDTATALTVAATPTDDVEYEWYKDGEVVVERGATATCTPDTDEAGEFEYFCRVYASDEEDAKYVDSNKVKVTVKDVPTITVENAKSETPLTWPDGKETEADDAKGSGTIVVTDLTKPLTLKANIENPEGLEITSRQWAKGGTNLGINDSITIQPTGDGEDKKIATGPYTFTVGFEGLENAGTYTVTVVEGKGTLKGAGTGIYTSTDGKSTNPTNSPEYTIQLPAGYKFATAYATDQVINGNATAENADKLTGPEGVKFTVKTVSGEPDSATATGQKMTFVVTEFKDGDALTEPYIKDMEATFVIRPHYRDNNKEDETVALTVTNAGYKITLPAGDGQVEMTAPEEEVYYDGAAKTATVEPAEDVEGLGEISNIRYVKAVDPTAPTEDELEGITATAPKEVGKYAVYCDIAKGDQYEAKKDVLVDGFEIKQVTPAAVESGDVKASDVFKMNPESAVYDGKNKSTTVTFKDGLTKTGKITATKYYAIDENGEASDTNITPVEIGKYQVKVTVAPDGETNPCDNVDDGEYVVGTFEITKTPADAKNYTIDPAEVTYDGTPREANIEKTDAKAGDVTKIHYFAEDSEEELEGKPTEAGVYTVKVDTAANDNYEEGKMLEVGTFTIKKSASEQPTIYTVGHVENIGWGSDGKGKLEELKPGGTVDMGTTGRGLRVEAMSFIVPEDYKVIGFAHVENEGDVAVKEVTSSKDYEIPEGYVAYEFGSTGKGQRVEAVCIGLQDASGEYVKGFQYAVHLQNYGWQGFVRNGSFSGTRGMGLRMESIRFTYSEDDIVKPGTPEKDS